MAKRLLGRVGALWRYPVKSMLGEPLDETTVTMRGVLGDRAWALRETATGRIVSAKKYPQMFEMRSAYQGSPREDASAPVWITMPGGERLSADDPRASELLSARLRCDARLERAQPGEAYVAGIDPATIFGDVGIDNIYSGLTAASAPSFFPLPEGTFFDSAAIHVIASATLEHLGRLTGAGRIDPRRLRANILVEADGASEGFVEDEWLGGMLEIGEAVKITSMKPALRCVMTTHRQEELERDPGILRAAAKHHKACVGVFASVGARGRLRVGDPVFLQK